MAEFHFVEDYERLIADLVARYPLDEAMSIAVGGNYEAIGRTELAVLRHAGLTEGQRLIDLGCGSGRLAWALGDARLDVGYLGIDIVQPLLDYARSRAPEAFRFVLHRMLSVPAADRSADMVCAFSVFTHLLQSETAIYLDDIARVLRPGGRLVFSFLEFASPAHWPVFEGTVEHQRSGDVPHLNIFIERDVIDLWAGKYGYVREAFIDGSDALWQDFGPLGQSIAILRRVATPLPAPAR